MRILDSETRLLTPMDPDAIDSQELELAASNRYYQLTHDYLVPSLRQWLTEKQQSTRRGRMKLRLTERRDAVECTTRATSVAVRVGVDLHSTSHSTRPMDGRSTTNDADGHSTSLPFTASRHAAGVGGPFDRRRGNGTRPKCAFEVPRRETPLSSWHSDWTTPSGHCFE